MVKKALKLLWKDTCSVYIQDKKINQITKRTQFIETPLFENQPCKLSFYTCSATEKIDGVSTVNQSVKIFLDNELFVPTGSKIIITRDNKRFEYQSSGEPAIFSNHQEISLKLFEEWA